MSVKQWNQQANRSQLYWKLGEQQRLKSDSYVSILPQIYEKPQRRWSSTVHRLHGWNCFRVGCQTQPALSLPLGCKASQRNFLGTLHPIPVPSPGAREMGWGSSSHPHSERKNAQTPANPCAQALPDLPLFSSLGQKYLRCYFFLHFHVSYHAYHKSLTSYWHRYLWS